MMHSGGWKTRQPVILIREERERTWTECREMKLNYFQVDGSYGETRTVSGIFYERRRMRRGSGL